MRCAAVLRMCRDEGAGTSSAFLHVDVFSGIEDDLAARTICDGGVSVLSAGPTPHVPLKQWEMTIDNGTNVRRGWSWRAFRELPAESTTTDIHCVTRWSKLDTIVGKACRSIRCWRTSRPTRILRSFGRSLLSSTQGPSQPWHRECTSSLRFDLLNEAVTTSWPSRSRLACWRHSGSSCCPPSAGSS